MGRKKLSIEEKTHVFTVLENGVPVKKTRARTGALIRQEVMMYSPVKAALLKKNMHKFSRRCLLGLYPARLQKDQKMPCRRLPRNL